MPEWRVAIELKKQYEVKAVGPDELAHSNFDVLVAVMPSSLTDPEVINLVDYIQRGKPTLIVDDPFPVFQPSVAPRQPKPRPGGPMGMMGGGRTAAGEGRPRERHETSALRWGSSGIPGRPSGTATTRTPKSANSSLASPTSFTSPRQQGAAKAFNPGEPDYAWTCRK